MPEANDIKELWDENHFAFFLLGRLTSLNGGYGHLTPDEALGKLKVEYTEWKEECERDNTNDEEIN